MLIEQLGSLTANGRERNGSFWHPLTVVEQYPIYLWLPSTDQSS
jgi:hypothetical protein